MFMLALIGFCAFSTKVEAALCKNEISLLCPVGFIDGCTVVDTETSTGYLTLNHVCVSKYPSKMEMGSFFCDVKIELDCDSERLIDACLFEPPVSEKHVCVLR